MVRFFAVFIVVLILVSAYWTFAGPWVFAKIPGDGFFTYQGFRIYIPFGTSVVLTLVINLVIILFESGRN